MADIPADVPRRCLIVACLLALATAHAPGAIASHDGTPEPELPAYPLVFPVVGEHHYSDTWHAPRGGGSRIHLGTDIMADKMTPVVAVADGTVGWMHNEQGGRCCAMEVEHDDGWASRYIHLNNDTPGTDDGLGWGFAEGIEPGVPVRAGQLIAFVGDSGNAEETASHVHFELHHPELGPVNPHPHLTASPELRAPEPPDRAGPCPADAGCDTVALVDAGARYRLLGEMDLGVDRTDFSYGNPGDVPLMGDWDCDGVATPAMYRPSNGFMYLRDDNTTGVADMEYFYGDPADIPIAGDWDGDGCDTLAIYRADEGRVYLKNSLGTGIADHSYLFGNPGDRPFAGDFDGDGIDSVGLYRVETGFVYFRNTHSDGPADLEFFYGNPGDSIVAADWDGDGDDTVAVYRPEDGMLYVNFDNAPGTADLTLAVGDTWATALAAGGAVEPLPFAHVAYSRDGIDYEAWDGDEKLAECLTDRVQQRRLAEGDTEVEISPELGELAQGWLQEAMEGTPPAAEEIAATVAELFGPDALVQYEVRPATAPSYLPDVEARCRAHDPTGDGGWAWAPLLDADQDVAAVAAFTATVAGNPDLVTPGYLYLVVDVPAPAEPPPPEPTP